MGTLEVALGEAEATPEEIIVETAEPTGETEVETEEVKAEEVETDEVETEVEEKVEPPSTSETTIPITAFHGVRDELKDLKTQFDTYKTEHPVETPDPTSVFDDEPLARTEMRNEILGEVNTTLFNHGLNSAYREFDDVDMVDKAVEWAKSEAVTSPFLVKQFDGVSLMDLPRKAVEVYQQEQSRVELENPDELKARIREEVKAELLADKKTTEDDKEALRASIPKTLVGEASKGGITSSDWAGPTPLDSVIGK